MSNITNGILLVQQKPKWKLHAALRFMNIEYETQNTQFSAAKGISLPLIVEKCNIFCEIAAYRQIFGTYQTQEDQMFQAYIEENLSCGLNYLDEIIGTTRRKFKINDFFDWIINSSRSNNLFDSQFCLFTNMTQNETLEELRRCYDYIESLLHFSDTCNIFLLKVNSTIEKLSPGLSEASLFGHIAEALELDILAEEIKMRPKLMKFFEDLVSIYFTNYSPSDRKIWDNNYIRKDSQLATIIKKNQRPIGKTAATYGYIHESYGVMNIKTFWTKILVDYSIPIKLLNSSVVENKYKFEISSLDIVNRLALTEKSKVEVPVNVNIGGIVFSSLIFSGFLVYGTLTTYGLVLITLQRRF